MTANTARGRVLAALACGLVLVAALAAASAAPARVLPDSAGSAPQTTGRLLAVLEHAGARPIERLVSRNGLRARQRVPAAALVAVSPDPGQSLAALRGELLADPAVKRVETEHYRELRHAPNDPAYGGADANAPNGDARQWNLRRQGFETAWEYSKGAGAKVAIVDTGVSNTQPDLRQVLPGDDHDQSSPTGTGSDEDGHGTHVAGLACANSDNGYGIASAGFDCQIIPEKLDAMPTSSGTQLTDASLIAGIYGAINRDADVINLSVGGGGASPSLQGAINAAWANEVVVVAAAENTPTTSQGFPARYVVPNGTGQTPGTCAPGDTTSTACSRGLVVTMAQYTDTNAGSGYGSGISISAYGDSLAPKPGIFSTFPAGTTWIEQGAPGGTTCLLVGPFPCRPRTSFAGDTRFAYLFGTSMATPQVSGLAALIRSGNPALSASQVVQTIRKTARGCGTWNSQLGFGIIDAGRAVALGTGRDITPPDSTAKGPKRSGRRTFEVRIERSDPSACNGLSKGIDNVSVFVARGKGEFKLLDKTTKAAIDFRGKRGKRYSFYTRALDGAGNREADAGVADTTVRIKKKRRKR